MLHDPDQFQRGDAFEPEEPLFPGAQSMTVGELLTTTFKPRPHVVEGILPQGLTVLAGKPKMGKSWLDVDMALSVGTGETCLGREVDQGQVLLASLEDPADRLQSRIQKLRPEWGHLPDSVEAYFNWPRFNAGGADALKRWIDRRPEAKLAVFDTWQFVKPPRNAGKNIYDEDVAALAPVKAIADERGIAILIILHLKKGREDDVFDEISGSTGITGTADTIMHLARERGQADGVLTITSRVMPESELALQFNDGLWTLLGNADEYRHSLEKTAVLSAIRSAGRPMSPAEMARVLNEPHEAIKKRMARMAQDGWLMNRGGKYDLPPTA
jgi:RecA-family ATPase